MVKKQWSRKDIVAKLIPSYLPSLIALLALMVATCNGVFEVKSERLELEKKKLEYEVMIFTDKKAKIISDNDSLMRTQQTITAERNRAIKISSALVRQIESVLKETKKFPCLGEGVLLNEDGTPLIMADGHRISLETLPKEVSILKELVRQFNKEFKK